MSFTPMTITKHVSSGRCFLRTRCSVRHAFGNSQPRSVVMRAVGSKPSKSYENKMSVLENSSYLSLAPMMEYTDRHFRHLIRLLTSRTILYTEMVAANAIAHERRDVIDDVDDTWYQLKRFLSQSAPPHLEEPCVLQLGGSDPRQLYEAAETVLELTPELCDYTALNLNCGCPSPKVAGKGCFGAALMDDPILVRDLGRAMYDGAQGRLPVTVKCRIGTDVQHPDWRSGDDEKLYSDLCRFVEAVASDSPVTQFQIHARIAVLSKNFSPADNRKIPPLKHDLVWKLAQNFPELKFTINGGINTLSEVQHQLYQCNELQGVMVGRGFVSNPWGFAMTDALLYPNHDDESIRKNTRWDVLRRYGLHADMEEQIWGTKIRRFLIKAVQGLFMGEHNAKKFRIRLDEVAGLPKKLEKEGKVDTTPLSHHILNAAQECLSEEVLFRTAEDSYSRLLEEEMKKKDGGGSAAWFIQEWQSTRKDKQEQMNAVTNGGALAEDSNSKDLDSYDETSEIAKVIG